MKILVTWGQGVVGKPLSEELKNKYTDISRAMALGYYPKDTLEDGLRETISEFHL